MSLIKLLLAENGLEYQKAQHHRRQTAHNTFRFLKDIFFLFHQAAGFFHQPI